jgi:hypothetical protein
MTPTRSGFSDLLFDVLATSASYRGVAENGKSEGRNSNDSPI